MTEIIGVRFKPGGKQYYFDPKGTEVPKGTAVIVETGKGIEYGICVQTNCTVEDEAVVQPLRPLVRLATQEDERKIQENQKREKDAMRICQQLVERHGLDMKLVQVEYSFDSAKIIFFFTAEGRVDFRALVKDLAGIFRARIELRQIGVRDEARMLGGFGICGKPFCCSQFLTEFQPVSIKMAKTQNLSLNPTKISGTCGRLMCCLKYEQDAYEDAVKRCPKQDSFVECPDGVGTVVAVNLLKEQVRVRLEDSTEQPRSYLTREIRVIRNGKGKRPEGYEPPPQAELEKLRDQAAEAARTGGRVAPVDVTSAVDRFLGVEPGEEKKSEGRRPERAHTRRSKEHKPVQPAPESKPEEIKPPKQSKSAQPKQSNQPKSQSSQPKLQPQVSQTKIQVQPTPSSAPSLPATEGEAKSSTRRHYRPHHRRGKRPSSGGEATS